MLHPFSRTELIIGTDSLETLSSKTVLVCGIGGVGSFVVEGLVRSGITNFILVDNDVVCITNINRQIHANFKTIGKEKVEVMKERILEINPKSKVTTYNELYNKESAKRILSGKIDYVVDAIDMVSSKLDLVERCKTKGLPIISSMGTGNKLNPTELQVTDISKTYMCPLAKVMRKELKKRNIKKLKVVFSPEEPIKHKTSQYEFKATDETTNNKTKLTSSNVPGSISFVPSVAGLIIASEVVKDLICVGN